MSARYAAKRILQAGFVVVMVAAIVSMGTVASATAAGLIVLVVGLAGFIAASNIPAETWRGKCRADT